MCAVHPLLCILKSSTKYCGPSRSLSFSTFHYVLFCSFSKFQWLRLWLWLRLGISSCIAISISICSCIYELTSACVCVCAVRVCVCGVCVCWFLVPLNWLMFDALNHNDMQQTTTLLMLRLMLLPLIPSPCPSPSTPHLFWNPPPSCFPCFSSPAVIAHFCSILFRVPSAKEFTLKQFASCCSFSQCVRVCVCVSVWAVRICEGPRRELQSAQRGAVALLPLATRIRIRIRIHELQRSECGNLTAHKFSEPSPISQTHSHIKLQQAVLRGVCANVCVK